MTHPDWLNTTEYDEQDPTAVLAQEVIKQFGADAEFAYRTNDGRWAMLTVEDIITICGNDIIGVPLEVAMTSFRNFYDKATVIKGNEDMANAVRAVGREALAKYE